MLNKISRLILLISICVFTSFDTKAQDPAFSQFYANPLYLNPAFAGAAPKGAPRGGAHGAGGIGCRAGGPGE